MGLSGKVEASDDDVVDVPFVGRPRHASVGSADEPQQGHLAEASHAEQHLQQKEDRQQQSQVVLPNAVMQNAQMSGHAQHAALQLPVLQRRLGGYVRGASPSPGASPLAEASAALENLAGQRPSASPVRAHWQRGHSLLHSPATPAAKATEVLDALSRALQKRQLGTG